MQIHIEALGCKCESYIVQLVTLLSVGRDKSRALISKSEIITPTRGSGVTKKMARGKKSNRLEIFVLPILNQSLLCSTKGANSLAMCSYQPVYFLRFFSRARSRRAKKAAYLFNKVRKIKFNNVLVNLPTPAYFAIVKPNRIHIATNKAINYPYSKRKGNFIRITRNQIIL